MKNGLPNASEKDQKRTKNCSFWLHEEWLSPQKEQIVWFLSEPHLSRKEGHLYFLPCQMHQKRKKKQLFLLNTWRLKRTLFVLFALPNASEKDNKLFLLTTWRMALTTKRAILLFLSERHLSRKEGHLYFLPCQMHQKRTKIVPFDYMKNGSHHKKSNFFVPFWTSSF